MRKRRKKVVTRSFAPSFAQSRGRGFFVVLSEKRGTMIEISNLKKSFYGSNEVKALDGVSLRVEKGEIFGIM